MKLVSDSYLFPRLDRAAFKAEHNGVQAPQFDPTRAPKYWSAVITAPTEYDVPDSSAPTGASKRTFAVAEAAAVNLPGPYEYAPTPYAMPQPWYACRPEDVAGLVALLNAGGHKAEAVTNSSVGTGTPVVWPQIKIDGVPINAAYLIPTWYSIGKDRKGTWFVMNGSLALNPAIETVLPSTPREDSQIPIHPLADGEVIVFGASGGMGAPIIETAAERAAASGGGSSTGGYTVQDRARDESMINTLMQIVSILTGGPK